MTVAVTKDRDARLLCMCMMADVIRIYAPDSPYDDDQLQDIFKLWIEQLSKVSNEMDPSFMLCFYLLEKLAMIHAFILLLEISPALVNKLFVTFYSVVGRYRKKVNNKIKKQFKLEHNRLTDTVSISPRSLVTFIKDMGQPEKDEVMAKIVVDGTDAVGQKHVRVLMQFLCDNDEKVNKKTGKKTGTDAGKKAGKDVDKNMSKDVGKDAYKDTGKDVSKVTGKVMGKDADKVVGKDTGKDTGKDVGKYAGKDVSKDMSKDASKDAGKNTSKVISKDMGKDTGKDVSMDMGKDVGKDVSKVTGKNTSKDAGKDVGKNTSKNASKDASKDTGKDTGKDASKVTGKDVSKVTGKNTSKNVGKDVSKDAGKDTSKNTSKDTGKDESKVTGKDAGKVTGKETGMKVGTEVGKKMHKEVDKNTGMEADKEVGKETGKFIWKRPEIVKGINYPIAVYAGKENAETFRSKLTHIFTEMRNLETDKTLGFAFKFVLAPDLKAFKKQDKFYNGKYKGHMVKIQVVNNQGIPMDVRGLYKGFTTT
eukprot:m51a1_g9862 hypothetical protein (534) ;mRNA; r:13848-31180